MQYSEMFRISDQDVMVLCNYVAICSHHYMCTEKVSETFCFVMMTFCQAMLCVAAESIVRVRVCMVVACSM